MRPWAVLRTATVLALALALVGCGAEVFQPTHTGVVPLDGESTVGQTFRPASGEVARVEVLVATYGRPGDPGGTLTVTLHGEASADAEVLARARVPGERLRDNAWVGVAFDGGSVDVGAQGAVVLAWNGAEPVALRANVPPATVGDDRLLNDPYPGGELLRDGQPAAGDLAFRVSGAAGPRDAAAGVARLARGAGSRLLAQPLFGVSWLLLLAGAAALAAWRLPAARRGRRPPAATSVTVTARRRAPR